MVINAVKQCGKRWTQVEAAATSITDIKDPQRFRFKIGPFPTRCNQVKFRHYQTKFRGIVLVDRED